MNATSEQLARRDLFSKAVDAAVKAHLDDYFNEEWMILRVPRQCVPKGATLAECFETEKEFVIMGQPAPDDESHDCDAMGCGTLSHVFARIKKQHTAKGDGK